MLEGERKEREKRRAEMIVLLLLTASAQWRHRRLEVWKSAVESESGVLRRAKCRRGCCRFQGWAWLACLHWSLPCTGLSLELPATPAGLAPMTRGEWGCWRLDAGRLARYPAIGRLWWGFGTQGDPSPVPRGSLRSTARQHTIAATRASNVEPNFGHAVVAAIYSSIYSA